MAPVCHCCVRHFLSELRSLQPGTKLTLFPLCGEYNMQESNIFILSYDILCGLPNQYLCFTKLRSNDVCPCVTYYAQTACVCVTEYVSQPYNEASISILS